MAPSSSKFCRSVDCPSTRVDSQRACGHRVAFRRHHRRCRRPIMASPTMPPTLAKSFSVSPSKLKVGDEEELQLLPSGCKIKVDWNLKSPKMELKNQTDGETQQEDRPRRQGGWDARLFSPPVLVSQSILTTSSSPEVYRWISPRGAFPCVNTRGDSPCITISLLHV